MESCKNLSPGLMCKAIGTLGYFEDRNNIGDFLKQNEAFLYIKNIYEYNLINEKEANLMIAAISDNTLKDVINRDYLRARIFKNMLIKI